MSGANEDRPRRWAFVLSQKLGAVRKVDEALRWRTGGLRIVGKVLKVDLEKPIRTKPLLQLRNVQLRRSASPLFLGGVTFNGSFSMKVTNAWHSSGDNKSCYDSMIVAETSAETAIPYARLL